MPIYEKADDEARKLLNLAMELYHDELQSAETTVDLLMASPKLNKAGEPTGPAVKLHGIPCAAIIRTVSYKERVKGGSDLEITIDADWWRDHENEQRIALLDHKLSHRVPKLDKDGIVKTDDLFRPKFNSIPHDFEFGWFAATALRHGPDSIEVQQAQRMVLSNRWQECIQKFLPDLYPHPAVEEAKADDDDDESEADDNGPGDSQELAVGFDNHTTGKPIRRPKNASKRR